MGKIHRCLKCIFIFFNSLFVILGSLMFHAAKSATATIIQGSSLEMPGLPWMWALAIGTLGVSSLGICAACSEKVVALKMFAGFMGIGMIIMVIYGTMIAVERNQMETTFSDAPSEVLQTYMKKTDLLEKIQRHFGCCGIVSAEDWGDEIPDSCGCSSSRAYGGNGTSGCTSKPQGTRGPTEIYAQSCGEIIFLHKNSNMKEEMGIFFGLAVTALLGLIITLSMIHQVKTNDNGESIPMRSY